MSKKKQIGILIASDWEAAFLSMTDKEAGALIKAIISWKTGDEKAPNLPRGAATIFPLLIAQQERNIDRYEIICEKRQAAALKRWGKEQNQAGNMQDDAFALNGDAKVKQNNANDMQMNANRNRNRNRNVSKDTIIKGKNFVGESVVDQIGRLLNDYYRRKESTPWSDKELNKLATVAKRPDALKEAHGIMSHYRDGYQYYYKAIETLLNNWTTACDRARAAGFSGEAGEVGNIAGHSPNDDYGF